MTRTQELQAKSELYWEEFVELSFRERFDHDGPNVPTTNEMERMLDQYNWYKKEET